MEFVAENPSPNPPHKGEGLPRLARRILPLTALHAATLPWGEALPQDSSSPLWRRLGEGAFPYAIGEGFSSRAGRRP